MKKNLKRRDNEKRISKGQAMRDVEMIIEASCLLRSVRVSAG
jgi:hypothetical protein